MFQQIFVLNELYATKVLSSLGSSLVSYSESYLDLDIK